MYYIALGASTCCQLTVFFLPSKRKGLLEHTVDNELSALARFSFYENLLIGRKQVSVVHINIIGVHIKRFDLKEKVRAFPRDK